MSRNQLLQEVFQMSYEDLEALYKKLGTINAVAKELSVCRRTVINWMRKGHIKGIKHKHYHTSDKRLPQLFRWIKEHPNETLPSNLNGIVAKTGLSKKAIAMALHRRRAHVEATLRKMSPIMHGKGTIKTTDGKVVPVAAITMYSFHVNRYSLKIYLEGELKNGAYFDAILTRAEWLKIVQS